MLPFGQVSPGKLPPGTTAEFHREGRPEASEWEHLHVAQLMLQEWAECLKVTLTLCLSRIPRKGLYVHFPFGFAGPLGAPHLLPQVHTYCFQSYMTRNLCPGVLTLTHGQEPNRRLRVNAVLHCGTQFTPFHQGQVVVSKVRKNSKASSRHPKSPLWPQISRHFGKGLLVDFLGNYFSSVFYFASRDVVSFLITSN